MKLEATVISDILYVFDQRTFIFIRKKSANFDKLCLWQPWTVIIKGPGSVGENLFYTHVKSLSIRGLREDSSQKIKRSQVCGLYFVSPLASFQCDPPK